jgi:hypothetical protein
VRPFAQADRHDGPRLVNELVRSHVLLPSSISQPGDRSEAVQLAGFEFLERTQGLGAIREQLETCLGIQLNGNPAVVNAVIDQVRRDAELGRKLGNGEAAGDAAQMRLAALAQDTVPQPDGLDRARQHCVAQG